MAPGDMRQFFSPAQAQRAQDQTPRPFSIGQKQRFWTGSFNFAPEECLLQVLQDDQPSVAELTSLPLLARLLQKHTSALSTAKSQHPLGIPHSVTDIDMNDDDDDDDDDDFEITGTSLASGAGLGLTMAGSTTAHASMNAPLRIRRSYPIWGCSLCDKILPYKSGGRSKTMEKHIQLEHGRANWKTYCFRWGDKEFYDNDRSKCVSLADQEKRRRLQSSNTANPFVQASNRCSSTKHTSQNLTAPARGPSAPGHRTALDDLPPQAPDDIDNKTVYMCPKPNCFVAKSRKRDLAKHVKNDHQEINNCKTIPGMPRSSVEKLLIAYAATLDLSNIDMGRRFTCAWCDVQTPVEMSRDHESFRICDPCRDYHKKKGYRRPALLVTLYVADIQIKLAAGAVSQSTQPPPTLSASITATPATGDEVVEIEDEEEVEQVMKPTTGKPRGKKRGWLSLMDSEDEVVVIEDEEEVEQVSKPTFRKPAARKPTARQPADGKPRWRK